MITQWKRVNVFISSTFNDMHAERDYLVKRVFPQLREWCDRRKLRLTDIDLRWGVTEQDATHKDVVRICLSRIDECRPFFLCFLGQRRGYVPSADGISAETLRSFPRLVRYAGEASVTELEILHAVLDPLHAGIPRDPMKPAEFYEAAQCAFFYLREPGYLGHVPADPPLLRQVYSNDGTGGAVKREEADRALNQWREERIPASGRIVRRYGAEWDPDSRTPELMLPLACPSTDPVNIERWRAQWRGAGITAGTLRVEDDPAAAARARAFNTRLSAGRLAHFSCGAHALSEVVLNDLMEAVRTRYPEHRESVAETDLEKEIEQQEYFLFTNCEGFIGRTDDFDELDGYLEGDAGKLFVLTGEAGVGKSTLLAKFVDRLRAGPEGLAEASPHFRFIGASESSSTVDSLLRSLFLEFREAGDYEGEVPVEPLKLRRAFAELLRAAGSRRRTVLVVDALNQLETGLRDLEWLPCWLPQNVKLIVSFKRGEEEAERLCLRYREQGHAILSEAKPFQRLEDRRRLVEAYLSEFLKELDRDLLETLISTDGAANPLYLKVVLSEVRVFGSFENLREQIYRNFGNNPVSAFQAVLQRLETDPAFTDLEPQTLVPLLFGLLAHARHGLALKEIVDLITNNYAAPSGSARPSPEVVQDAVNLYLRQVRPFLAHRGGRYDFFYDSFKNASASRYTAQEAGQAPTVHPSPWWHQLLAQCFRAAANPDAATAWSAATSRPRNELPYHLLRGEMFEDVQSLYGDAAYLEAMCLPAQAQQTGDGNTECDGIIDLLSNLQDGIRFLGDTTIHSPSNLVPQLQALRDLLIERSRLIRRFPRSITQEIANYLDVISSDASARALRERSTARVEEGLLVRQKTLTPSRASGHQSDVTRLAASPSGRQFLSGAKDGTVAYWHVDEDRPRWMIGAHKGQVTWAALSPSGQRALSAGEDGSIFVWDLELATARPLTLAKPSRIAWRYASLCVFLDDETIVIGFGELVVKLDLSSENEIWVNREIIAGVARYESSHLDFAPGANRLAVGEHHFWYAPGEPSTSSEMRYRTVVWDAEKGEGYAAFDAPAPLRDVALSADGNLLVTADGQGRITAFDVPARRQIDCTPSPRLAALCRASHGSLFYGVDTDGFLLEIRIDRKIQLDRKLLSVQPRGSANAPATSMVAVSPGRVAVGFESGGVALLETDRGTTVRQWSPGTPLCTGAVFPEGRGAIGVLGARAAGGIAGGKIAFVLPSGEKTVVDQHPHSHLIYGVAALGPELALTVDGGGTAVVWDRGEVTKVHTLPEVEFWSCAGWQEARVGLAGTQQHAVVLLGLGDSFRKLPLPEFQSAASSGIAALCAAGKPIQVLAAHFSGEVSFSGTEQWAVKPSTLRGSVAALDPKCRLAACGTINGDVYLLRCSDGTTVSTFPLHEGVVTALAFSHDGSRLYSAGADRYIYAIDLIRKKAVYGTLLPATPIALLAEAGDSVTVLDVSGALYRFASLPARNEC
jgi:WD40 repeat protein